jgi:GNAT superfamily N-acetyltransferase
VIEVAIRAAKPEDVAALLGLIKQLAAYERLEHEVSATEEGLRDSLFGPGATAGALLAWRGEEAVGYAVFFPSFSTFLGRPGLYVEDLFVLPAHRGQGVGSRLLAEIARLAVQRGCARLEWAVLDWNRPAIDFYLGLGARPMSEWTVYRLTGEPIRKLASRA